MLNLQKSEITQRVALCLTKKSIAVPAACNVVFFADISGSFEDEWRDGLVSSCGVRVLAVASRFDDDGDVPFFLFHDTVHQCGILNYNNVPEESTAHDAWFKRQAGSFKWGGTKFAPIFKALLPTEAVVKSGGFFGFGSKSTTVKKDSAVAQAADPRVVYVLTDGDAYDYEEARQLAKKLESERTYVMFVNVSQLASCAVKLSKEFDHVGHVYFGDLSKVSDEQILEALMTDEFLAWRKKMG